MDILVPLCLYKGIINKRSYYSILTSKTSSGFQMSTSAIAISIISYIESYVSDPVHSSIDRYVSSLNLHTNSESHLLFLFYKLEK